MNNELSGFNSSLLSDMDFTNHLGDLNLRAIRFSKKKFKRIRPFEPDGNFKSFWDLIGMILVLFEAIVIPYRVAFNVKASASFLTLEYFIDFFFLSDIGLNFYTGFYKKGNLILKRGPIVRRYFKTWFFPDLFASFPYTWFLRYTYVPDIDNLEEDDGYDNIVNTVVESTGSNHSHY
jgi:hypothetical protein